MKLYLVRHGKDTPNVRGGWSNEPLTDEGIHEVIELSKKINDIQFDYVLSSDLKRVAQTCELLVSHLNWSGDVSYESRLREVNNGKLAGMPNEIAEVTFPGLYWNELNWDERYPEGESPKEFFERISSFLDDIKALYDNNDALLMITHHGVIEVILSIVSNVEYSNKIKKYKIPTASLSVVDL
ncbi:histidine phosphatase family protein [Macrococcus capreoli]|uniref:histidine phosphatase family protein n=1 Tax=Macrococcus capreoli TaxID=2982690 RepID=UPI003EE45F73